MAIQTVCEMHGVYRNECQNKWMIMQWHEAFLEEWESTEKLNSSEWPSTSIIQENVNTVITIIREDRHLFIWDLTAQINIPKIIVPRILTKHLKMQRIYSAWVLHFFISEQSSSRMAIFKEGWKW